MVQVKKCLYEHACEHRLTLASAVSGDPGSDALRAIIADGAVLRGAAQGADDKAPLVDISVLAQKGSVAEASENGIRSAAGRSATSVTIVCAEAATATRAG